MALTSVVRFRPFSHELSTFTLLPGSAQACEITPCHIRLYDYDAIKPNVIGTISYPAIRPLEQFCVTLDLEKGHILVSSGSFRLQLAKGRSPHGISIHSKELKVNVEGVVLEERGEFNVKRERLTLGCDKAQEWPQVVRRGLMAEILPIWYYLSQSIAKPSQSAPFTGPSLFTDFANATDNVVPRLKELFQAGFTHMLVPTLEDTNDLGFEHPVVANPSMSPLQLLHATGPLIRRLFFREDDEGFHFLPLLPSEFHCGTLSPLFTAKGHTLMLEWTKHTIRRVHITAAVDDLVPLFFSKNIRRFRLRSSKKERGGDILPNGVKLQMRQNCTYLLDNFEK